MEEVLANIVTTSNKVKFDLPINKCKDMGCVDDTLPTLIIGYDLAKKYINGFNILKKYYKEQNIYWTFKRTERGIDYENDIKEFYNTVINDFCKKNRYLFVDIIGLKIYEAKKMIKFIKSDENKLVFNENNRFLYVYCEKYQTVFGFSLSTSRFFGVNSNKIVKMIKDNPNNEFVYDFTNIPNNVKHIIGEKIDKYMVLWKYFK